MSPTFYHILHVFSVIVLTAYTFYGFSNPVPENRRKVLAFTGIASLLALISGFGLVAKMQYGWGLWLSLKLVAWLGLASLGGVAFRKKGITGLLTVITLALVLLALYAVYVKPV